MDLLSTFTQYKSILESNPNQIQKSNISDIHQTALDLPFSIIEAMKLLVFKYGKTDSYDKRALKILPIPYDSRNAHQQTLFDYDDEAFETEIYYSDLMLEYEDENGNYREPRTIEELESDETNLYYFEDTDDFDALEKCPEVFDIWTPDYYGYPESWSKEIQQRILIQLLQKYGPINESNPNQIANKSQEELKKQSIDTLKPPRFLNIQLHQSWLKDVYNEAIENFSDDDIAILDEQVVFDGLYFMFENKNSSEIFHRANDDNRKIKTSWFRNGFEEFIENYTLYMAYDYEIWLENHIETGRETGTYFTPGCFAVIDVDYEEDHPNGKTFKEVVEEINNHIKTPESSEFGSWASGWIQNRDGTFALAYNFQEEIGGAISMYQEDLENYDEDIDESVTPKIAQSDISDIKQTSLDIIDYKEEIIKSIQKNWTGVQYGKSGIRNVLYSDEEMVNIEFLPNKYLTTIFYSVAHNHLSIGYSEEELDLFDDDCKSYFDFDQNHISSKSGLPYISWSFTSDDFIPWEELPKIIQKKIYKILLRTTLFNK